MCFTSYPPQTLEVQKNVYCLQIFTLSLYQSLKIITKWVSKNVQERERDFNKLIYCVQWNNVDQSDIFKHVELCSLYSKSELCLFYFLHALSQHNIMAPNFKNRYDVLSIKYEQVIGWRIPLGVRGSRFVWVIPGVKIGREKFRRRTAQSIGDQD